MEIKLLSNLQWKPGWNTFQTVQLGSFVRGPIVLAKTSTDDLTGLYDDSRMGHETRGKLYPINEAYALVDDNKNYVSKLEQIDNMDFKLDSLTLQPFYKIHDARYQMYFQTFDSKEYKAQKNFKTTRS
jgi:hypothetical protein